MVVYLSRTGSPCQLSLVCLGSIVPQWTGAAGASRGCRPKGLLLELQTLGLPHQWQVLMPGITCRWSAVTGLSLARGSPHGPRGVAPRCSSARGPCTKRNSSTARHPSRAQRGTHLLAARARRHGTRLASCLRPRAAQTPNATAARASCLRTDGPTRTPCCCMHGHHRNTALSRALAAPRSHGLDA